MQERLRFFHLEVPSEYHHHQDRQQVGVREDYKQNRLLYEQGR